MPSPRCPAMPLEALRPLARVGGHRGPAIPGVDRSRRRLEHVWLPHHRSHEPRPGPHAA